MESYQQESFPKTLNLFEDEEASFKNFKILISTPVGFNSSEKIDPFHPVNQKIGDYEEYPNWVKLFY